MDFDSMESVSMGFVAVPIVIRGENLPPPLSQNSILGKEVGGSTPN